ncbi:hypothetical protein [Kocuria salina]|uniref:hypothetical protein n=1 Tax=Kocuria salina TaxID=1929416 RepID=UPI0015947431|nr:hypothetical protein [Kocuria salina]
MTDHDERRVEQMLRTAKTKADLEDLVRMLDRRNVQLQRVRDRLAHLLHQARQEQP